MITDLTERRVVDTNHTMAARIIGVGLGIGKLTVNLTVTQDKMHKILICSPRSSYE